MFERTRSFLRLPRTGEHLQRWMGGSSSRPDARAGAAPVRLEDASSLNEGHCTVSGGVLHVVTDPRSGGYSALVPLAMPMSGATPARFRCSLELIEGAVGLSAVTPDCTIVTERTASRPG